MKLKLTIILVITAFIGMAVFGTIGMRYDFAASHSNCVAALAGDGTCPGTQRPFEFAAFHLGILKYFSTAFLTAVVVFGILLATVGRDIFLHPQYHRFALVPARESWILLLRQRRWQARHLHSPTGL